MTEDNIRLTRRKILAGAGAVGLAGAGAGLGTSALFSDTESFEGSTLTAGTLDLLVGYYSYWDQGMAGSGQVQGTKNGDGTVSGELTDVKPGDEGLLAFCPRIDDNPAYLWLCGELTANDENSVTEPEADVDPNNDEPTDEDIDGEGELAQNIEITVSYCDIGDVGEDGFDPGDVEGSTDVWSGSFAAFMATIESGVPLDGDGDVPDGGFPAPGSQACFAGTGDEATNPCLCIDWSVPADVGNEIQSDSMAFDLAFHAEQCRNNDGTHNPCEETVTGECPTCEVDTSASQSPEITVQSTDASSFPQVSTFLQIDTPAGTNGDLVTGDFALCEAGCGQDVSVEFTSEDKPVDFVFLLDVTGSMGGELNGLKSDIQSFINSVDSAGVDARYALYLYGDEEETGPPAVYLKQDFTSDAATFDNAVQNTSLEEQVGFGGDEAEDNYEAILTADTDLSYRTGSQRVMIDITDAPGEEDPDDSIGGLPETRASAVSVLDEYLYIAVAEDVDGPHEKKTLANDVDGLWIQLGTDFGPILDEIETEVGTSYRVQYTTANPVEDGNTRPIVIEIDDPDAGTLYATTTYTAPS